MSKSRMPKLPHPRKPSIRGTPSAFSGGGSRAFSDPSTMQAPDQAFGAAMALPQGEGAPSSAPE